VLLETKLHAPTPGPNILARPPLSAVLGAGADKRLTLVSASAGFGKTTVLAAWCAAEKDRRPVGWVSLDPSDNDLKRLWTYVVEALRRLDPAVGDSRWPRCGLLARACSTTCCHCCLTSWLP
jgi:LuxR family transcriptional regulator, maltose regulon positive regulatory protein